MVDISFLLPVRVAAAVVAHRGAEVFGAHLLQLRRLFPCGVQIGNVSLMMLVVMQMHRLFVDVGFQSRVIVGKRRTSCAILYLPPVGVDAMHHCGDSMRAEIRASSGESL